MAEEIKIIITADGVDQVSKGLNATSDALKKTATEATKTGQALNSTLKPGAAQAGQSLTNLSRIAQDAPFGFIGIQNNISPLIESFGRLKAETGSTGGALKALVQGLAGPAGLGLAVGVGTALLTAFGDELFKSSKEADVLDQSLVQLGKDITAANDDFKAFSKDLDNAQKTNAFNITARFGSEFEGQFLQAQANFVTTSEKLVKVQEDINKARQAYNEISDKTPNNATEEQIKLQDDARKGLFDLLEQEKELIAQREQIAAQNRSLRAEEDRRLAAEKKAAAERLKNVETIDSVIAKLNKSIADQDILANILGTPRIETIQKDFKLVEGAITKLVEKFNLTTADARLLKLQIKVENLESILKPAELIKVTQKTSKELQTALSTELKGIKIMPEITLQGGVKNIKNLEDFTQQLSSFFESAATGIATTFGETLANVISGTATFGDFFKGLLFYFIIKLTNHVRNTFRRLNGLRRFSAFLHI